MRRVEQVLRECYIQPSGVPINLRLLEVRKGYAGHPYTVERCIRNTWQQRRYNLTFVEAEAILADHRAFEERIGSIRARIGESE